MAKQGRRKSNWDRPMVDVVTVSITTRQLAAIRHRHSPPSQRRQRNQAQRDDKRYGTSESEQAPRKQPGDLSQAAFRRTRTMSRSRST
jgi:hypothetical protein